MEQAYVIRCPLGSAPRMVRISKDNKYIYVLSEKRNKIDVYKIINNGSKPDYENIQTVSIIKDTYMTAAAATIEMSRDEEYIYASIDAVNSLACLKRDMRTGLLKFEFDFRVSGDYPKYITIMPNKRFVVALNHDSDEMRSFEMNYKHKYALMRSKPVKVYQPNCLKIIKLPEK